MAQPKIELDENLWLRVVKSAEYQGYSSPQQFIAEVLERELAKAPVSVSDQEVTRKMEELGYLDYGRDI
jgi:hypothetical protein